MKRVFIYIVCALMLAAGIVGCAQKPDTAANDKMSIVTTIFPPYDFARSVAQDMADVHMLIPPGTEVHTYDPSPGDMIAIQNADIFIYIGGENERWVDTVLSSIDTSQLSVLRMMDVVNPVEEEVVEGMQDEHTDEDEHEHTDVDEHEHEVVVYDEHIWTSPQNASLMTQAICDVFKEVDSANADSYQTNADAYIAKIDEVGQQISDVVTNASTSTLVVGDRFPFRYMAEAYGLAYRAAFAGCSAQSEVSAATLAYLIDYVKDHDVKYVYYIEFGNKHIAASICEQTGAQMLLLHSGHNVTTDEFESGITYVDIMRQNAENLRKGLG